MSKPKILIVDDDPAILTGLSVRLRASGYEPVQAADAVMALSVAQRERPALILLDLGLPGGDGFTVMERIATLPTLASTPVIVLSARDPEVSGVRAKAMGARAFLQKPVVADYLLSVLREHCPPEAAPEPQAGAAKKIMIVEDDPDIQMALSLRLRAGGFTTITASDAIMAMPLARREQPDAILLDLGLPGGDGFCALGRLREVPSLSAVPVIVVSAREAEQNRDRALAAGADAYLQKPVDAALLLETLRNALSK